MPWDSMPRPSHKSNNMFIQTLFLTYSSSFQFSKVHAHFRDAGIKKLGHLCMAAINSYEKKLL